MFLLASLFSPHLCSALGNQWGLTDALELELLVVVSCHVSARNPNLLLIMEPSRQPLESFSLYIWGHLLCLDCCSGSTSPSLICLCRIERQPYQGCVTSPPVCSIGQHVFTHPFLVLIANVAHSWGVASCQNSARTFMTKLRCCHLLRLYTQAPPSIDPSIFP